MQRSRAREALVASEVVDAITGLVKCEPVLDPYVRVARDVAQLRRRLGELQDDGIATADRRLDPLERLPDGANV